VGGTTQEQLYDAFGAYVRSQRHLAKLTLRQVADLARISNPYLSQIEHGLVLPSIAVLNALADALSVSAETMLLRAAGVVRLNTPERAIQTEQAIRHDTRLDTGQKQALLAVLASFVASPSGVPAAVALPGTDESEPSDPALPNDAVPAGDSEPNARVKVHVVHGDGEQAVVRRGPLPSMSDRPATAGRVADPRRQGV
jgi:transcriptional regulator with XRE-family HTH domain